MSKLSTATLISFLFSFLIRVASRSISAPDKLLGKADAGRFSTYFETVLNLLECLLGIPEISNIFEKEFISGKRRLVDKYFAK